MKKLTFLSCFLLVLAPWLCPQALAQNEGPLRVVKSIINAESENAELCLEFDRTLASLSSWQSASALRLVANGKTVTPSNITVTDSSLCLFPLEHGTAYRLSLKGLRGTDNKKMAGPYALSFTIPNRSPGLSFTSDTGGVNEFGFYDKPLTLRAINVGRASLDVYHVTDVGLMIRAWKDRALMALAPSESAYLAREKGKTIWRAEETFDPTLNATTEQNISLREKMPDLKPGLYLIVADSEKDPTNKEPLTLAASWFINSDFSLRAVRDSEGVRVFASGATKVKNNVHLMAFGENLEQLAETKTGANGIGLISYPQKLEDKNSIVIVVGNDAEGNVAFADIENLPSPSGDSDLGVLHIDSLFVAPFDVVDVFLSSASTKNDPVLKAPSILRLSRGDYVYADFPVSASSAEFAKMSFLAPALRGDWSLFWQKTDGTPLAETTLRVTSNPDAPRLEAASEHKLLASDGTCSLTIKALSASNRPIPLVGGHVFVAWQKLDPKFFGWNDYIFGTLTPPPGADFIAADFLTNLEGKASLRLTLSQRPKGQGLYQAALKVMAAPDSGIADAPTIVLPLRPEETVIGVKPLATGARFPQNGLARFSLIGISSDGRARDVSGLSYQVYEEGRSFDWYQDEGRWKYKPEAQLRPIGGGALAIKADARSVLEWPVAAGTYRLEILDVNGKTLVQTTFSAGWDSASTSEMSVLPLTVQMPTAMRHGHEIQARVFLPEPAILTAIIADTRIRKAVHEFRPKGNNIIAFTPAADWAKSISLMVEASSQNSGKTTGFLRRALKNISLA
jgi:hypothetical protein